MACRAAQNVDTCCAGTSSPVRRDDQQATHRAKDRSKMATATNFSCVSTLLFDVEPVASENFTAGGNANLLISLQKLSIFTVRRSLHGICYSNSVRPSVCLSVCHTRGLCPHGSTYDHDFFTTG